MLYFIKKIKQRIFKSKAKLNLDELVIIHSMGKVGSSTVLSSLNKIYSGKIYHTHFLNKDRFSTHYNSLLNRGMKIHSHLNQSKEILECFKEVHKFKIITLIREPIDRNVSAYFENLNEVFIKDFVSKVQSKELSIYELIDSFIKDYSHEIPLNWLDMEIKEVFGIDIYKESFPIEGYQIIESTKADVLIIRLDKLNTCFKKAISEFLSLNENSIELLESNVGLNKNYKEVYTEFKKMIELPLNYITEMYSSKYTEHFFKSNEIELFKNKWKIKK